MSLSAPNAATTGCSDGHRGPEGTGTAIAQSGKFTDDLIECGVDVVGKLNLGDRAQSVDAHPDRRAQNSAFGDRRIEHAVFAIFALQPFGGAEHAAEVTDVFSHQD